MVLNDGYKDPRIRKYIMPKKILWQSGNESVLLSEELLKEKAGQATVYSGNCCEIKDNGSILLDFGVELHGGIQLIVQQCGKTNNCKLRVRFGESAMEAMSEINYKNSTNDHAVRDMIIEVSAMGMTEIGNTGFRFIRLDLLDNDWISLKMIRAVLLYKDLPYLGSFKCSDPILNEIWETGAYTVHLNMQDYLWDGIKRDRLVWVGDMHPETSTITAVFGYDECVPKSLDFVRDETSPDSWMNGIPSYSLWWIIIHYEWFMYNGDMGYLKEQGSYISSLIENILSRINADGTNNIEHNFIDWSTNDNQIAKSAGLHALLAMAVDKGGKLCGKLGRTELAQKCGNVFEVLINRIPEFNNNKPAAALLVLSGILDAEETNRTCLSVNPAKDISTFFGYYILKARAAAGDIDGCISLIKDYWGLMLRLGATTFWESFNMDWAKNAARIDELTPDGMYNTHGDSGEYCYKGYRHSLCHGWASGPTAWITEYVLGVSVMEEGCKKIKISPSLGTLEWAEGTYPTPLGIIKINIKKQSNGKVETTVYAPEGIEILKT